MSDEFTFEVDALPVVPVFSGYPFPGFMTIAPWCSERVYAVGGRNAVTVLTEKGIKPNSVRASKDEVTETTWQTVYFKESRRTEADAAAACFPSDVIKNPTAQLTRIYHTLAADTIPVSQFELSWEQREVGFGSGKHWQPWNLVTIPSTVHAYAVVRGWDVSPMAFREISDPKNVSVEFTAVPAIWDDYLTQRAKLWDELGEPNAKASLYQGAVSLNGKPATTGVTSSEKLSEALKFALGQWKGNYYVALGQCGSPFGNPANFAKGYLKKVDQSRIIVCNGLWRDKVAAEAFVAARKTKADEPVVAPVSISKYDGLPFPDEFRTGTDAMNAADFYTSVYGDTIVKDEVVTKAVGAAKIAAKNALTAKLAEYGQTLESWAKIKELVAG